MVSATAESPWRIPDFINSGGGIPEYGSSEGTCNICLLCLYLTGREACPHLLILRACSYMLSAAEAVSQVIFRPSWRWDT